MLYLVQIDFNKTDLN